MLLMLVEIPIIGQAYPSTCISETRLLRLRGDSWAMATLLKNFCMRVRPSCSMTKFESFVLNSAKMLDFPISSFVSRSWGGVYLNYLQGCVERVVHPCLQGCVDRVVQIDIMGTLARDGVGIRYGMVAIDIFTKIAEVIPIRNRQPTELTSALKSIFQSMGKPKQLYSDEESSFRAKVFFTFIHGTDITHTQTSTHAPSAGRFIRTFKDNLYRRLDGLKQDTSDWVKHVDNVINKYNNTEHNTTKIKPSDAINKESRLWVNWHLQNNVKKDRKYTKINEGGVVRVNIKKVNLVNLTNLIGVQRGTKLLMLEVISIIFQV